MIGRIYTVSIANESHGSATTLVEVASAADSVTTWERVWITQSTLDTSENIGTTLQRITTTGTGTATTARPYDVGTAAFGGTCKTNHTIEPTYTASLTAFDSGFNMLSGFLWTPANDDEIYALSPSGLAGFNIDVAPSAGAQNFTYGCTIREIG